MKDFITAAVFSYPHEIAILRHLLTEAGINFYFENETITAIAPLYSHALGGIKLKVHTNDLDTVKEILKNLEDSNNLKIV
ncbi:MULTISPECIES: DUF2007 domain-containing protein [Flavobacterium]|uniref:Uncharacterized protein n=2 Tax=Flavobacterium TaxID=237 RepID=A0A0A2LVS6_9FLAO|nr:MULTISPECIES: DUF2007 domain-containing protein [Flavobacterium]KGO83328.1 hypothetical protein Q763_04765 [Flavobacterium beibuense F44-8]MEE1897278.1 DUF2007 domain-containing protein [Flavobacterium rakeshii]MUV05229.1 DUF2007 domain-containing protein [Flavobacterium rakeshii]